MIKQALIFGASGGLGFEVLKIFLDRGIKVFATTTDKKKAIKINKKIKKLKKNVTWFTCDFHKEQSLRKVIKLSFKKKNHIDVIVNCGAVSRYDGIKKINYKMLIDDFKVNLFSNIIINSQLAKLKNNKKKILVISIGSSSSYYGFENTISYCSSKHGLLGAIKSINSELIKKKIINTSISMGSMKTSMGKKVKNQNYNYFIDPKKVAEYIYNISALNIEAYLEDVFFKRLKF